jgi:hypothetical protein
MKRSTWPYEMMPMRLIQTLPGNRQAWEEQRAVMGPDPWKYGINGNEKVLNTIIRYVDEQGLLKKKLTIQDLFVAIDEPPS